MAIIWIADLWISTATRDKIQNKHSLNVEEVANAIVAVPGLPFRWHYHTERGWRVLIDTVVDTQKVRVVLYPRPRDAYGDAWDLASAYPIDH